MMAWILIFAVMGVAVIAGVITAVPRRSETNTLFLVQLAKRLEAVEKILRPEDIGPYELPCEQGDGPCSYEKAQKCCIGMVCPLGRAQDDLKDTYTRAELRQGNGRGSWYCGLCRHRSDGSTPISHAESCPLADDTVMAITVAVVPEAEANATICGQCNLPAQSCPAYTEVGGCTHARLMELCDRYKAMRYPKR